MSDENTLVKDLPEDEKQQIINEFKELQLSGVPLKMAVVEAKALITKTRQDKSNVNQEKPSDTSNDNTETIEQAEQKTQTVDIKPHEVKPPVQPECQKEIQNETKNKSPQKEKKSDGKCVICSSPVFKGVCSGCGVVFRG